jgi:hypothetical protein
VFTRAQLLQEVWGYDFFGGTRTVDVHVRRLRAKLGPEHEQLVGTVPNVGYKFVRPVRRLAAWGMTGKPAVGFYCLGRRCRFGVSTGLGLDGDDFGTLLRPKVVRRPAGCGDVS